MTCLHWGCDPLEEECESCLDVLCNVCHEEFKERRRNYEIPGGDGDADKESHEPDCDDCNREKKPDCSRCEIILAVCSDCGENKSCEFRICGPG